MNILVPHHWLEEYLIGEVKPEILQKELSLRGPSVERINWQNGEAVYDIEVTTNRVDSMSIRGLAREAAVILQQVPELASKIEFRENGARDNLGLAQFKTIKGEKLPLPKITIETDTVNRILCVVLDTVTPAPTPDWMARRLLQVEENIHYSTIDITNYITHELGHPCHAFDYDKIMALGGEIVVKIAQSGQEFTTLDGNTYKTVGGEIVFTNGKDEIIDLPAIKGTANTAIDENMRRVLFWLENLDAMTVRRASMSHAIRTVAATLNEKNVDPHLASETLSLGVQLFEEICGAHPASAIYDYFPAKNEVGAPITLHWQRLNEYLGVENLDHQKVQDYLSALGMKIISTDQEKMSVRTPSWRAHDVQIEVDLIEEIARLYGYHNLPNTLNFSTVAIPPQPDFNFEMEALIKENLSARGYFEVYTSSLVSEAQALADGSELENHLKTSNPLTADKVYLRQSLVPSLQEVFAINKITTGQKLSIFELAKNYFPAAEKNITHHEKMYLTLLSNKNYREVIGDFYQLLAKFYLNADELDLQIDDTQNEIAYLYKNPETKNEDAATRLRLAKISVDGQGKTAIECELAVLQKLVRRYPTYQPINRQPSLIEDLTFTVSPEKPIGEVIKTIHNSDELIADVALKDIYQQNFTFTITYQGKRILENKDVAPLRQKIVDLLAAQKITLVGKLPPLN